MAEIEIDDIASIGSVRDVPAYMLPPEAWTLALNMRYADDGMEALDGWAQVFGTPLYAPHFAFSVSGPATNYWIYTSLAKAAVYDGSSHSDITRLAGDYTTTDSWQWNKTFIGGIPILNNGVDVPQMWNPQTAATKLQNLTNWDPLKRALVVRAFGSFLIAINTTESGVQFPHRVLWSHPADPGTVPASWNVADPTRDAGQIDLPDVVSGTLNDALPLGSTMFLYKESSVWRMRYVGGQQIFDFGQSAWLTTAGLLSPRCVCISGDGTKHVLATQDDIIWHNGNTVNSILNKRQRRRLQSEIDTNNYFQSFIFANPFNNEIWFCYPQQGSSYPDRALILNYKMVGGNDFVVTEADGVTFRNAALGNLETAATEAWDAGTDTWIDSPAPWTTLERRKIVLCNPTGNKMYSLGGASTRDGASFTSTLQREGLSLLGKTQKGDPVVDFQKMKMLRRLWPKVTGGTVNVRFASQQLINGASMWGIIAPFDPDSQTYVDPGPVSGRAVGFELSRTGSWRIDGYKIDVVPMGDY